jgi:hypothetical protein
MDRPNVIETAQHVPMGPAFNELRAMGQNLVVIRDLKKVEDSGNPATQAVTLRHEERRSESPDNMRLLTMPCGALARLR